MRDTIDMAREANEYADTNWALWPTGNRWKKIRDERFAEIVRADEREQGQRWFDAVTAQHKQEILAEREACAKVCDEEYFAYVAADAIRARSNT